ncbi:MAG: 4-oxalocrotonate decarboxylase [Thermodesulfobacteriota bacterium]
METETMHLIATAIAAARASGQLTSPPSTCISGFDLDSGYRIGRYLHAKLIKQGYQPAGRKIGFTNRDTWKEFDLQTPIWAYIYDRTVQFAEENSAEVSLSAMVAPRLEPELVFKINKSLKKPPRRPRELLRAVEWMAMGFEIVDCHYPDWKFTAADAVADFGVHALLVVGNPAPIDPADTGLLEEQLHTFQVILKKEDRAFAEGTGANALGSPLLALSHLCELLSLQEWAEPVQAGELITTGTLTRLPYIFSGEKWKMETNGVALSGLELFMK